VTTVKRVLILQHISCEPPGVYEDVLVERGVTLHRVEADEGEAIPDGRDFDAIIAMGGPMGTYDEDDHPWLVAEKHMIRDAVESGVPYFGACLGAQLLAASLGGDVYPGPAPEVGVLPVQLTAAGKEDPVAGGLPPAFPALQWHSDTFDLPRGAELLASSAAYAGQLYRWGDVAYGVQFHLEVTGGMAAQWSRVPAYADALERVLGPGALAGLLADFARAAPEMQGLARRLFGRWLDHVGGVGRVGG
jgi:GMP synthase-like glutamine amidotransferase